MLTCFLSARDWANPRQRIKHFYSCSSSPPVACWGVKGGLATWSERRGREFTCTAGLAEVSHCCPKKTSAKKELSWADQPDFPTPLQRQSKAKAAFAT